MSSWENLKGGLIDLKDNLTELDWLDTCGNGAVSDGREGPNDDKLE